MNAGLPLTSLHTVAWNDLEHAYGSAGDVPDMLRQLLSPDAAKRAAARSGLHASLDHQGVQRFEATLRSVPFLIGLVADPSTPERAEVARLLAEFAVGDTCWFLHNGVHPREQTECDGTARPQAFSEVRGKDFATRGFPTLNEGCLDLSEDSGLRFIYDAVAAGTPVYLAALEGADEDLRAAIPFVLAWLTVEPSASAAALERLLDDASERVRASAMLGLSHATKFVPALRERAFAALAKRWDGALGDLERRCLALALVRWDESPDRTVAARAYLRGALAAGLPKVIPDERFPWVRIDSAPFVFCSTFLATADGDQGELCAPACAALPRITDAHDAADLALWIVQFYVPEERPRELDAELRATLSALATSKAAFYYTDVGNALEQHGFPGDRGELANSLGHA